MEPTKINLIVLTIVQIILALAITGMFFLSLDKKEFTSKTILIIIVLLILSLALPAVQSSILPATEQEQIQSTLSSSQEPDCTQKAIPKDQNTEKNEKVSSESQPPAPSGPQWNTTEKIISKMQCRDEYIIVSNQYAQSLNSFLESHGYKQVATTPDGILYEYKGTHFGWR